MVLYLHNKQSTTARDRSAPMISLHSLDLNFLLRHLDFFCDRSSLTTKQYNRWQSIQSPQACWLKRDLHQIYLSILLACCIGDDQGTHDKLQRRHSKCSSPASSKNQVMQCCVYVRRSAKLSYSHFHHERCLCGYTLEHLPNYGVFLIGFFFLR